MPILLWGIDIVGGVQLVSTTTGEIRVAEIVTGVDDHSRFCGIAHVVERATARAVCLAFASALAKHGVLQEVVTDNGKQFTDRFSRYWPKRGEVLSRQDLSAQRDHASPHAAGLAEPEREVERFRGRFRPEIGEQNPLESPEVAEAAVDAWVDAYNFGRPHQALEEKVPVVPAGWSEPAVDPEVEV